MRYTELFYSLQGEGKYVGTPSILLRLFGCNLRCPHFGVKGRKGDNPEVIRITGEINGYSNELTNLTMQKKTIIGTCVK